MHRPTFCKVSTNKTNKEHKQAKCRVLHSLENINCGAVWCVTMERPNAEKTSGFFLRFHNYNPSRSTQQLRCVHITGSTSRQTKRCLKFSAFRKIQTRKIHVVPKTVVGFMEKLLFVSKTVSWSKTHVPNDSQTSISQSLSPKNKPV